MTVRRVLHNPRIVALLIGVACELLFLFRLSVPGKLVFDEVHYVPAARALIALSGPVNVEHPLLAKELIALGMLLFGDDAFGWRVMSTLAGSATIVATYALVWLLTGRLRSAAGAALLALLAFTVFVQARIAMLDTFMLAFLLGAIVMLVWSMRHAGRWRWCAGAVLLGLATACKWTAAPYVAFAAAAYWFLRRNRPERWRGLPPVPAVLLLGALSVGVYFLTFAPAFFYATDALTLPKLLRFQLEMYHRQTQVLPPHTYQSTWWTWPLLKRPIWYLYEPVDNAFRGILMIGNPVVMWGGLAAVAACWTGWVRDGSMRLLGPALLWTASVGIFAIIPKSLGFYYYYYPSSIFLVVCIAVALDHWRVAMKGWDEAFVLLAFGVTIYFLPVLTAQALTDPGAFRRWTWLASWV